MPVALPDDSWALILGGSSGFGLATAHELSRHGMHLCLVHRDRRGAMPRIQPEFDAIRARGVSLVTFNEDALSRERRGAILDQLAPALGERGKVRLLLHSIAFGNLKLIAPEAKRPGHDPRRPRAGPRHRRGAARRDRRPLVRRGQRRARRPDDGALVPGRGLHRGGGPAADDPRHGHEPARLGPGRAPARPVRRGRAGDRPDERGQRGRLEGLRGGRGGQGRARVDQPCDRGRDGAVRPPLERRSRPG